MTKAQIREALDDLGIEYAISGEGSLKADLQALLDIYSTPAPGLPPEVVAAVDAVLHLAPEGRWITEPYSWTGLGGADAEAIVDGVNGPDDVPQWRGTNGGGWAWIEPAPAWALAVTSGKFTK